MSTPQFDIVFRGLRKGADIHVAKTQFAALFKLDAAKTDRIFKSRNVTLKNHADERLANIFVARLLAIGVVADKLAVEPIPSRAIYIQDMGEVSPESSGMHQPVEFLYGEHTRRLPFVFSGSGFDYFKLWLVNVVACVLSAFVLYPWVQVRALRYFYQHTYLDGIEFSYTSNPQKIFLVQFALILYLSALAYGFFYAPLYCAIGVVALIGALPFYWYKNNAFQLLHSFYCDTHFQQSSSLGETYKVFLMWPLLAIASLGLAAPYAAFKIQQYRVQTLGINDNKFLFSANIKAYLMLLPSLFLAEAATFACVYYREYLPLGFSMFILIGIWLMVFIRWRIMLVNLQWNAMSTKLGYFVASWDLSSYTRLLSRNLFLCLLTLGFYWPWARINSAKYKANHLAFFANQGFRKWQHRTNELNGEL